MGPDNCDKHGHKKLAIEIFPPYRGPHVDYFYVVSPKDVGWYTGFEVMFSYPTSDTSLLWTASEGLSSVQRCLVGYPSQKA